MHTADRLEAKLVSAVSRARQPDSPPSLFAALRHAVFPGGARVRPRLCLAVAEACGAGDSELAQCAAASIELLHCASLVHDDLPCFDDAPLRRGRPSVHAAFGEQLAVLAGDALIVMAFDILADTPALGTPAGRAVLRAVTAAVGAPCGIVAGQAWECERDVDLSRYHRQKTGSLFVAAASIGALCGRANPEPWRTVGDRLGEAYQIADDLADTLAREADVGKPVSRDATLGRPNAASRLGTLEAIRKLEALVGQAADAVPPCIGAEQIKHLITAQARRLLGQGANLVAA